MNTLGLAAPNRIRCTRTAVARPCRGSLRLRGLVVDTKLCPWCGGDVIRQPNWDNNYWAKKQFCSRSCANRATGQKLRGGDRRRCQRCGSPIMETGTTRVYCSRSCYDQTRAEQPSDARALGRSRAQRRYAEQPCEVCGATRTAPGIRGAIHRHHRDGDQTNNDASNIAFLCRDHHTEAHASMAIAGVGRRSGGVRPRVTAMLRDRAMANAKRAAELRDRGLSTEAIASELGVHTATVTRWFLKYDL